MIFRVVSTENLIRFQYQDDPKYAELLIERYNSDATDEIDKKIDEYIIEKNRNPEK